jgi:hypothetical protein
MDLSKGVPFDPGYSKYTLPFSQNIDAVYNMLFSIKSPHQRKFKFQVYYPQILKLLEHTVSFYLGCLLWAAYISKSFKDEPKEILNNHYTGKEVNDEEMLFEVNYAASFIDKLKKDCNYYLSKKVNLPDDWAEIFEVYKEFLTSNNFLVDTQTTKEIKLPAKIKDVPKDGLEKILNQIEQVTSSGELKDLFKVKSLIL